MSENLEENPVYQCRLCLNNANFCYSLFDEDVIEIIESFTSIKIEENDDLPSICCSECLQDVYTVHRIRCRLIESDRILREKKVCKEDSDNDGISLIEEKPEIIEVHEGDDEDKFFTAVKLEVVEIAENPSVAEEITINPELNEELKRRIELKRKQVPLPSNYKPRKTYLECVECDKCFTSERALKGHANTHNHTTVCNICGKQVSSNNFKKHLSVHNSEPQVCELCGALAKNAESLRGHMFYMHKSTAEQYKCNKCNKFYRYKYKFTLHMRKAHGGDRDHTCEICGKAFYTVRDVTKHVQMTHMKLRPYVCQYCNKGFSSAYARRTHVRQHTNETPFKCELCAEGFRQRVSLKTHLKSKHGVIYVSQYSKNSNRNTHIDANSAEGSSL